MEFIKINTPFIKLDQLLKFTGVSFDGAEAKDYIISGRVKVNGETETRRGRKLFEGDVVNLDDNTEFKVQNNVY